VVSAPADRASTLDPATARDAAAGVVDPELRAVTIEELGILRDVRVDGAAVTVTITPTYSGCPAMDVIRSEIRAALRAAGFGPVEVVTVLRPAWSTDWISASGRAKLAQAGIAPPGPAAGGATPVRLALAVRCPRCGSPETAEVAHFGSTACKALWRCRSCTEPFEHVKAI
jgi:ring-1,2-phenylacetyl-CoA epoxidase subunit PaaD